MKNEMKLIKGLIGVVVFVALFALLSPFSIIESGERGVVKRLGNVIRIMTPGFNLKTPLIETVETMDVREKTCAGKLEVSSSDVQTIAIEESLVYSLNPEVVDTIYTKYGQNIEAIMVKPTLAEVTNAVVAQYAIEDFVAKRPEISKKIEDVMRAKLEPNGIVIKSLLITNHDFSKEFNAAIEAKKVAEQNKIKAQYIKETKKTEAEADAIKGRALNDMVLEEMRLKIQEKAIEKWDGHMPQYMAGNELPFMLTKKAE